MRTVGILTPTPKCSWPAGPRAGAWPQGSPAGAGEGPRGPLRRWEQRPAGEAVGAWGTSQTKVVSRPSPPPPPPQRLRPHQFPLGLGAGQGGLPALVLQAVQRGRLQLLGPHQPAGGPGRTLGVGTTQGPLRQTESPSCGTEGLPQMPSPPSGCSGPLWGLGLPGPESAVTLRGTGAQGPSQPGGRRARGPGVFRSRDGNRACVPYIR